jgi:hypothetical protein
MMAKPAEESPLFLRLPAELRRAIWRQCLPHRVMDLDIPDKDEVGTYCQLCGTTFLNTIPPIITRVCLASRKVALENGGVQGKDDYRNAPSWSANNDNRRQWFSPATDIVHLNWALG